MTGLPLYLRGDDVYCVLGDQCGGFLEADESSADLGSLRLCVGFGDDADDCLAPVGFVVIFLTNMGGGPAGG